MEVYETEEQQAEAIKKWFKENGKSLFTSVLLAAFCVLGVKYWLHHKEVVKYEASEHYMGLMMSQMQQDEQSAISKANTLINQYPKTPYAQLAGLFLAKTHVENQETKEAIEKLTWVMDNSTVSEFSLIARARAARIQMSEKRYEEALALLDFKDSNGFTPILEELKGDVFVLQKENEKAIKAYQTALSMIQSKDLEHPLLKLKLQDLGGDVPVVKANEEKV